ARCGRVGLVVILVVISSYISWESRGGVVFGGWSHALRGGARAGVVRGGSLVAGSGGEAAALLPRRCRSGPASTARLSTPGNARGRSHVPGTPYSLTVALRRGNHFLCSRGT